MAKDRIFRGGYVYTPTKARKGFECLRCPLPILPGTIYLIVERSGSGVRGRVYADRIHEHCLKEESQGV